MAKLRDYEVADYTPSLAEEEFWLAVLVENDPARTAATVAAPPDDWPPGLYYRYVEPLQ
jgi:hypothetical protein